MIDVCDECPMRLFNVKHHNLQGIGNPYMGRVIVIPNVDYDAYKKGDIGFSKQVEIILASLSLTGDVDVLNNLYITPFIRCNETIACELNNDIYNRCLNYFIKDLIKYKFQDILLLGNAGRRFLNCDIKDNLNNIIISKNYRKYAINYSPLIKYISNNKFETFNEYLIKWYNAVINKYYLNYNIIYAK